MKCLEDCDLEFSNLKDTRPKLPFTLIFRYKRSTHAKEKGEQSTKEKIPKGNNSKNRIQLQDQLGNQSLLFSHLLFNHENVFDG